MASIRQRLGVFLAPGALLLAAVKCACPSASACDLSLAGKVVTLEGEVVKGDEFKFRELLSDLGKSNIAAVRLNSPGGNIYASGEIGRQIRQAGFTTLVDASHDICASACTVLFASGMKRLYLNAPIGGGVMGHAGFRGLGFHQGSTPDKPGFARYSGPGTAAMMSYYYEFGVPSAAGLVDRAPPEAIFALSGPTALSLGIATSLR